MRPRAAEPRLSLAILNLALGGGGVAAAPEAPESEQTVPAHQRRKPIRKPLPDALPRVAFEVLPPEVLSEGLDGFKLVGSETREVLERRPASCVVVAITYKKFIRKDQQRGTATDVLAPPTLELPIDRGLAGPSMLADTIVRRWQDHQPLTRLSDIYRREQLDLAKSTLCTWHEQLAELVRPLVAAMFEDAYREPYLCVDATGVLVLAKEKCRNGHFWVLVAPEKHVLYGYSRKHDSLAVDNLLKDYKGYLVADAHSVYEHLYTAGEVIEVACWAHARRYFYKALDSDPDRAKVALSHIGALFRIERTIADSPRKERESMRRDKSRAIVDKFFDWCGAELPRVLDETPIQAALRYATNQRIALRRFLDDGRLPAHNNISEVNLRRSSKLALRRKRRRRCRQHRLRLAARQRAPARNRVPRLPQGLVLSDPRLAQRSHSRTRPRLLAKDSRAARNSGQAGSQRLPPRRAFAAVLNRASTPISTARRAIRH